MYGHDKEYSTSKPITLPNTKLWKLISSSASCNEELETDVSALLEVSNPFNIQTEDTAMKKWSSSYC